MAGRIRTIKPELLDDGASAGLSDRAARLMVACITLADDHGRLRAEPGWLRGQVWWARPEVTVEDVEAVLVELDAARILIRYTVDGQRYAYIRTWAKNQKVDRPSKPRCPDPPDQDSRDPRETLATVSRDPREGDGNLAGHSRQTPTSDPDLRPRPPSTEQWTRGPVTGTETLARSALSSPWSTGQPIATTDDLEAALSSWGWAAGLGALPGETIGVARRILDAGAIQPREIEHARSKAAAAQLNGRSPGVARVKFFLTVVEGDRAAEASAAERGSPAPNGGASAWEVVTSLLSNARAFGERCADEAARTAVREMGGATQLSRLTDRDLAKRRTEFLDRYARASAGATT